MRVQRTQPGQQSPSCRAPLADALDFRLPEQSGGRVPLIGAGRPLSLAFRGVLMVTAMAACASTTPQPVPRAEVARGIVSSIYLIGDAGAPDPAGEPVLRALVEDVFAEESLATVVFLGDNIYPGGMPSRDEPGRMEAERRIGAQINAVLESGAAGILVPGNHDWNGSGSDGRARVIEEERFGERLGWGRVRFLPGNGCPGPVSADIGERVRVIAIDTEWWLHQARYPPDSLSGCPTRTEAEALDSLRHLLAAGDRAVIVVGHHPLVTHGTHGGFFNLRQHVFPLTDLKPWLWLPLPVLGTVYPLARKLGTSHQDVSNPRYRNMIGKLSAAFAKAPPLVYASGHEHSLQILDGVGARYQVVSGTGIEGHVTPVTAGEGTLYHAGGASGFVRLDVQRDGRIRLAVETVDADGRRRETYSVFIR